MNLLRSVSLLALASCALAAHATVIDFEGLAQGSLVGNAYANLGVHFTSDSEVLTSPNYAADYYPPHSGVNVVNNRANPIAIRFDSAQNSVGAWVVGALGTTLTAYSGSTVLGSVSLASNYGGPAEFLSFSGAGITDVTFSNNQRFSGFLVLDDLTFTPGAASAVPGPLAALPFALMALRRRKRS